MRKEKTILSLVIILFMILLILCVTGIGYAAQNDNIIEKNEYEYFSWYRTDFNVVFSGKPTYRGNGLAEVEITGPRTAKFNISEFEKVGDFVTVIFTLENQSSNIDAEISVDITNTNTEYFKVTSRVENNKINSRNGKTNVEVEVELIKLPIGADQKSDIGINILAESIQ